nr:Rpn family recombination-promoting nuclease/putative transposase [Sulfurovum sp. bin170]
MKKILRQKANFGILEGFLTELLKFDVKIEEILESEANQETEDDKFNRVDLLAKNENGELILIEVQHSSQIDYFNRMLYGSSKLITEYIKKGDGYVEVKKVYSVNIVYFELGQGRDYIYHGKTKFKGLHEPDEVLNPSQNKKDKFSIDRIYEIYPEYFVIRVNQFNNIAKNSLDEWIYFLKNEEIKDKFKAKGLDEAKKTLDVMKLGDRARAVYNRKQENKMYKASLLYTAKIEGEKKAKIEIAKNLLDVLDIATISLKTGLMIEEIEKLK